MAVSNHNIALTLDRIARECPEGLALHVPATGHRMTFAQLREESQRLASGLSQAGLHPGVRTLLFVPFGPDFVVLTFALFQSGALPVLIDPGLGLGKVLDCIRHVEPRAMIAVSRAHAVRKMFPSSFRSVKIPITVGRRWFWGGPTLAQLRHRGSPAFGGAACQPDDPAAILFTSGSTGAAKGVVYTHGMFHHQREQIRTGYDIRPGEIDLPTFPLFGLFGPSLGMTCLFPDMDFTRPAGVDPEKVVRPIQEYGVTSSFGSPALWDAVGRYCRDEGIRLPSLRRIVMAGAPVPGTLLERFDAVLDQEAEIYTPYGATEALPVTRISRTEILNETWAHSEKGKGYCVGKPVPDLSAKIIRVTDEALPAWDPADELPRGEIGEIVVQGPWVTREYDRQPEATRRAKIPDGPSFWHRMGDVGWMDAEGRLWFCGRKNHRVVTPRETLYPIPCEAIFNRHPEVRRSALVGVGRRGSQKPVMVIEPETPARIRSRENRRRLEQDLLKRAAEAPHTRAIRTVLFHPRFPVDVRHNAKIFREQLTEWAASRLGEPEPHAHA